MCFLDIASANGSLLYALLACNAVELHVIFHSHCTTSMVSVPGRDVLSRLFGLHGNSTICATWALEGGGGGGVQI